MLHRVRGAGLAGLVLAVAMLSGCATERASVSFGYVVEPNKGLPRGMQKVAILPAKVGASTDPKWQEMSVELMSHLINESRTEYGTDIRVEERTNLEPIFEEQDLVDAGLATRRGDVSLGGVEGFILSNINVKVDTKRGKQRTVSGLDIAAIAGGNWGGGRTNIETEEVETVTRNLTVQTSFKLVDASTGQVWHQLSPSPFQSTERTEASPFFGSSQTEAELTPTDRIIGTLVERGARRFVSQLMKTKISVMTEIASSSNESCMQGVRMLRVGDWGTALMAFQVALQESGKDHAAAFGAGLASEAMGKFDQAERYYRQAGAIRGNREYLEALERVRAYGARAQGG
jgi:hypothetical protein